MMKRLATVLMAMAAAGAWSGTVRMGALSTDTTVETLGESAAAVQLVSKARIDQALASIAIGGDDSWMVLNGSTGLIYQVVLTSNIYVVATSGAGYNGPAPGSVFSWSGVEEYYGYWKHTFTGTDGYTVETLAMDASEDMYAPSQVRMYRRGFFPDYSIYENSGDWPLALEVGVDNPPFYFGSPTLAWQTHTNVYQLATTGDLPDLGGFASYLAATNIAAAAVAASPVWLYRTGLSGTVTFANDAGRPQAWSGTGALTVSGFSGLQPPAQVYWTLSGFDSVTLPAGVYVVGGGAWQTNMVNHFVIWQVGTNVMLNFITATEVD